MAYAQTMMGGSGVSAGAALAINGGVAAITPAGSAVTDATAGSKVGLLFAASTGSGTGIKLAAGAPGDSVVVANQDASNALLVYPPSAAKINNLTVTTQGFSIAANTRATLVCYSATQWVSVLSA